MRLLCRWKTQSCFAEQEQSTSKGKMTSLSYISRMFHSSTFGRVVHLDMLLLLCFGPFLGRDVGAWLVSMGTNNEGIKGGSSYLTRRGDSHYFLRLREDARNNPCSTCPTKLRGESSWKG